MAVYGFPIRVLLERVGMHHNISVIYMRMIKENIAPEESEKKDQEKITGYIRVALFQKSSC